MLKLNPWLFGRWLPALLLCLGLLACSGFPGGSGPRTLTIPAERLQRAVAEHFPYQQGVTGWLEMKVQAPRITLIPERNRIAADVDASLSGRWIARSYSATLGLEFGLRFEPSDNSLRITQLNVTQLQLSDVPEHFKAAVRQQAPQTVEGALSTDMKLYQFSDEDIRKARDAGYAPTDVRVTAGGISITLTPIAQ
jgi:hypothetical protein